MTQVGLERSTERVRPLLLGQKVVEDQSLDADVQTAQIPPVELQGSVFALLEGRDGRAGAEQICARLDEGRQSAPHARALNQLRPAIPQELV